MALAVVVFVGVVGGIVARVQEDRARDEAGEQALETLAETAASVIGGAASSLGGANAIVEVDGTVTEDRFEVFEQDLRRSGATVEALGYVELVPGSQRAGFESDLGRPVTGLVGDNFAVAPSASVHWALRWVRPSDPLTELLVGFDLGGNDVTRGPAEDARDDGSIVVTEAIQVDEQMVVVLHLKALYRPGSPLDSTGQRRAAHVGFLVSALSGQQLASWVADAVPDGTELVLSDDDVVLAGAGVDPDVVASIDVGGRTWMVGLRDGRPADHGVSTLLLASAALLSLAVGYGAWRDRRSRRDRERASRLARSTAELARRLSGAHTSDDVAEVIGELVPAMFGADAATLGTVDREQGVVHLRYSSAADPRLPERFPAFELDRPAPVTECIRTGETVLVANASAWRRSAEPEVAAQVLEAGVRAIAALPMKGPGGTTDATVGILWGRPDPFDPLVVASLETLIELCSQSLARAATTDRARQRTEALAEFARSLANVTTTTSLSEVVMTHAPPAVEADVANVGFVDPESRELLVRPNGFFPDEVHRAFARRRLDDPLPGSEAVRTGELVLVHSVEEAAGRFDPRVARAMDATQLCATAHLPLVGADGEALGVIGFGWRNSRDIDGATIGRLRTVAQVCAQTLERVGAAEAEHHLVGMLQRRVVGTPAAGSGWEVAARYLPAADQIGMGGDWFDVVALDDHRTAVVVGDIAGHGLGAVADMLEVRAVIRSLLRGGMPIEHVLDQASFFLASSGAVATACVCELDDRTATLRHVSAGHPPPVVVDRDGATVVVEGGRRPLLGVLAASATAEELPFPPGSTVVVCTDGLIERRDRDILASIDEFERVVARSADRGDVGDVVDTVIAGCLTGANPQDDVAVVAVRHRDDGVTRLELELTGERRDARTARRFIRQALGDHSELESIELAVSELTSNAVLHARPPMTLRMELGPAGVRVAVHDTSATLPLMPPPSRRLPGGRGLRVVDEVSDRWGVTPDERTGGKWVWAWFGSSTPGDLPQRG